jgi:hemoglobin-like flavoprotein
MSVGQMTHEQVAKLVKSWTYILENSPDTGIYFYNALFAMAPEFKVLFSGNHVNSFAEKFMSTMTVLLSKAYKGHSLVGDVQHLAIRHVGYGVSPEHYPLVGKSLLVALEYGLKEKWNSDLKILWTTLYDNIAEAMIKISDQARNNLVA